MTAGIFKIAGLSEMEKRPRPMFGFETPLNILQDPTRRELALKLIKIEREYAIRMKALARREEYFCLFRAIKEFAKKIYPGATDMARQKSKLDLLESPLPAGIKGVCYSVR